MASAVAVLMLALLMATSALPMRHGAAEQLAEAEAAIDHMLADAALERRAEFTHSHEHGGGGGGGAAGVDERVGGHEIDALAGGALAGAALERSDELTFSCARASDGTCARPSRVDVVNVRSQRPFVAQDTEKQVVDLKDFLETLWTGDTIGAGGGGKVYVSRPMRMEEIARAKIKKAPAESLKELLGDVIPMISVLNFAALKIKPISDLPRLIKVVKENEEAKLELLKKLTEEQLYQALLEVADAANGVDSSVFGQDVDNSANAQDQRAGSIAQSKEVRKARVAWVKANHGHPEDLMEVAKRALNGKWETNNIFADAFADAGVLVTEGDKAKRGLLDQLTDAKLHQALVKVARAIGGDRTYFGMDVEDNARWLEENKDNRGELMKVAMRAFNGNKLMMPIFADAFDDKTSQELIDWLKEYSEGIKQFLEEGNYGGVWVYPGVRVRELQTEALRLLDEGKPIGGLHPIAALGQVHGLPSRALNCLGQFRVLEDVSKVLSAEQTMWSNLFANDECREADAMWRQIKEYRSLPVKFDGELYNPDGLVVVKVPIIMNYEGVTKDDFSDFYMEAAWSQHLSDSTHPNFMKVFGWGVRLNADGTALDNVNDCGYYLLMEKLGHDLDKFAAAHQFADSQMSELKYAPDGDGHPDPRMFLHEEMIAGMVAGVASALLWLHSHHLVHRDVKGLNVMLGYAKDVLTDEPDVEIALARFMKLIDVGRLAKIADGNDPPYYRGRMALQYAQRSELSTPSFMPPELLSSKVAAEGHLHVMEGFRDVTFSVEGDVKEKMIDRDPSIKDSSSVLFYFVHTTVTLSLHGAMTTHDGEVTPTYTFVSRAYHHDDFVKLIDDLARGGFITAEEVKDKSDVAPAGFWNTWKVLQDKETADRRKVRYEKLLNFIAERMRETAEKDDRALAPMALRAFLNAGVTAVERESVVLARARAELPKSDIYALGVMMYQLMDPQDRATQSDARPGSDFRARLAIEAQKVEDKRESGKLEEVSWEFFQSTFRAGEDRIEQKMFNYDGGRSGRAPYSDGMRNLCIGMLHDDPERRYAAERVFREALTLLGAETETIDKEVAFARAPDAHPADRPRAPDITLSLHQRGLEWDPEEVAQQERERTERALRSVRTADVWRERRQRNWVDQKRHTTMF